MSGGPDLGGCGVVATLLALAAAIAVLVGIAYGTQAGLEWMSGGGLTVGLPLVIFGYVSYLTATIARVITREEVGQGPRFVVVNTFLLLVILGVGALLLREYVEPSWVVFGSGVVIALQTGTFLCFLYRRSTFARLLAKTATSDHKGLEDYFRSHSVAYVAIPVGVLLGAMVGALRAMKPSETLGVIFAFVFLAIALGIALQLIFGATRLSRDYSVVDDVQGPEVRSYGRSGVVVAVPAVDPSAPESIEHGVDGATIVADIRKVFLINQYQLLAMCALASIAFVQLTVGSGYRYQVAVGVLGFGLCCTQIPYIVGQQRTHERILHQLVGVRRIDIKTRLAKYSPLMPKLDSWAALIGSGTLGGVASKLVESAIKSLLKQ